MKSAKEGQGLRRGSERASMRPLTAAAVLAAVVVVVGVVGYFAVTAVSHSETKSSTEHACTPAASSACGGTQQAVSLGALASGAGASRLG